MQEIEVGHEAGVDLPRVEDIEWIKVCHPAGERDVPLVTDMGPGETEVLMLTIERTDAIAVLDDGLARRVARMLDLPFTGTLGILLDAKKRGLITEVRPLLHRLEKLRFHLSKQTTELILKRAGEQA
jgi:hypothetical protein